MTDQPAPDHPVERMARALAGAAVLNPRRNALAWHSLGDAGRERFREQARRIINPPAPTDLRDQYAAAIREAACSGGCGATEEECRRQRIQPEVWHWGVLADVSGTPEMFADAVLAVRDRELAHFRSLLAEAAEWIHEGELRERICDALDPQEGS